VGEAKRPLVARVGVGALRAIVALILFILILLLILRALAWWREGDAQQPAGMTRFPTAYGAVAAHVNGPADGPPILLIHGTAAWSGFWREVADHLAARGWRVVAIDLPPFGWSERDPEARYDRATQAKRLSAVVAALGKPATVVGHSFGAGPATEFALAHPEQVRGLVLVDAALGELDPKAESTVANAMRFLPLAELVTAVSVNNPAAVEPLLRSMIARKERAGRWVPTLREPMARGGTTSAYSSWLPNLFTKQDGALSRRSDSLRSIRVPVSVVWGDADTVTPIDQGKRISELTRARSLQVLPGVGHIPHIEDPEGFRKALDQALASLPGEGK